MLKKYFFILGLFFGTINMNCLIPASTHSSIIYSRLGLPFIVTGTFFARAIDVFAPLKRNAPTIEKIMGLLLVVVGILLFTGGFSSISFLLLEYFPILTTLG